MLLKKMKYFYCNNNDSNNNVSSCSMNDLKNIHDFRRNTREQRMSTINQHVKLKKK